MARASGIVVTALLSLVLGWIPVIGHFLAGLAGGYVAGGRMRDGFLTGFMGGFLGGVLLALALTVGSGVLAGFRGRNLYWSGLVWFSMG